jgi:hypothetical protein
LFVIKGITDGALGDIHLGNLREGYMVRWLSESQITTSQICDPFTPDVWCTINPVMQWSSWLSTSSINIVSL